MSERSGHWLLPRPMRLWWFRLFKTALLFWLTIFHRMRATGKKNLPTSGGYLIVANHQSLHDPPIIGTNVKGEFHPLARATLFDIPVFGWGIANCNAIPVRQDGGQDRGAIQACIDCLKDGGVVAVFPEGARTPDGEIHQFEGGAALIARRAGVPVVPAAIAGAFAVWPRHRMLPRFWGRLRVSFGEPISPERIAGMKGSAVTGLFEDEVRRLFAGLRDDS